MNTSAEPLGTLEVALRHAARLLEREPAAAAEQAAEILKVHPDQPDALALSGLALGRLGKGEEAIAALRRAVHFKPDLDEAWRALGDHYSALEMREAADEAFAQHLRYSTRDPKLMGAALALAENRIPDAEAVLRDHLKRHPTDVVAIRMLAEVAARIGRTQDAETLLARCVELAPGFRMARQNYAMMLHRQNKWIESLEEVNGLLEDDSGNPGLRNLKAAVLGRIGNHEESIAIYRGVLREYPRQPKVWMSLGHALKTANHNTESIEAYRRCIELAPQFGEVWWSLANLKTFRFTAEEIANMRAQLERDDLTNDDRFHFHFTLGKALEDAEEYAASFEHYARGNALRRKLIRYDAAENSLHVDALEAAVHARILRRTRGLGQRDADPIFVRGLAPLRLHTGRTDPGQHSQVEGTQELPDIAHARPRRRQPYLARRGQRVSASPGEVFRARSCSSSGKDISRRPASSARRRGRSSSTRCRTTSRTWASFT